MGNLKLDKNLFDANASAGASWASISGGARFDLAAGAQFKRGIDLDLGLQGIAQIDANFSKFVSADLSGEASAQASIRGQIQLPLNLFGELGAAVRLQAIAELAAGVRLGLSLNIGEFLDLAGQDPNLNGLPMKLLRVVLEQAEITASFYAKAALSAQAYANFVIVASVIGDAQRKIDPGFTISAGAGAGLKAGAGYQVLVNAGVKSFASLIAKTADVAVNETVASIQSLLPQKDAALGSVLEAARVPLKLGIRLAFEVGDQLTQRVGDHTSQGQDAVGARVVQVCLEELQKATLEGLLESGCRQLRALGDALQSTQNLWDATQAERFALADKLDAVPEDMLSADAIPMWVDVAKAGAALATKVPGQPGIVKASAILWASAQLFQMLDQRVTRAKAEVSLLGKPALSAVDAFAGAMPEQPPSVGIGPEIRAILQASGAPVPSALNYEHLVLYLIDSTVFALFQTHNAPFISLLNSMVGPAAPDLTSLYKLILKSGGAFAVPGSNAVDPTRALQAISGGIQSFVQAKLDSALRAQLDPYLVANPDLRMIVDEVLLPSLDFTIAVVFKEIAQWAGSGVDQETLTEALSAILLRVLGRGFVALGDILVAEAQKKVRDLLLAAAAAAGNADGILKGFANTPISLAAEEVLELVQDALECGADVFGPLPEEQRTRIRGLLYSALDPLAGSTPSQLLQRLSDPALIPNVEVLEALASELGGLAASRFMQFVEALFEKVVAREIAKFQEALAAAVAIATEWIDDLVKAVQAIEARLTEIVGEIEDALAEAAQRLEEIRSAVHGLLDGFSNQGSRQNFISSLVSSISSLALAGLEENWIYRNVVPGNVQSGVRSTVRGIVRSAVQNQVVDGILTALGTLSDDLDHLVDNIRALDRNHPLGPQIRNLILNAAVAAVDDVFGTVRIPIHFDVGWNVFGIHYKQTIDLGEIKVDSGVATQELRAVLAGLSIFDPAVNALAGSLAAFFAAEDTASSRTAEKAGIETQHAAAQAHLGNMRGGTAAITIVRPVELASLEGDVTVQIQIDGINPSILDHDDATPERFFIILNGQRVDPKSLTLDVADHPNPAVVRPISRPVSKAPVAARQIANRAAVGLPALSSQKGKSTRGIRLGSPLVPRTGATVHVALPRPAATASTTPAPSFTLTGKVPLSLVRSGLNSLMVQAIRSKNNTVQASAGFLHSGAVPAAPIAKPAADRSDVFPLLPKAKPAAGKNLLYPLDKQRKALAQQLSAAIPPKPVAHLHALAATSPKIGTKLNIVVPPPLVKPGTIQLKARAIGGPRG